MQLAGESELIKKNTCAELELYPTVTGKYQQLEHIREQLVCRAGRAGSGGLNEPAGEDNTAAALQTWRATSLQHFGWAPS